MPKKYLFSIRDYERTHGLEPFYDVHISASSPKAALCAFLSKAARPNADVLGVFQWSDKRRTYIEAGAGLPTGSGDYVSVSRLRAKAQCR